jgi:kinetochore protein Mis12/MTW1
MRNILTVKADDQPWIRLGHYEGLDFDSLAKEGESGSDKPSIESVNGLRRKLLASQRLNAMLHAEKTKNEALLGELKGIVGRPATKRESDGLGAPSGEEGPEVKQEAGKPDGPGSLAFLRNKGTLTEGDSEKPLSTTTAFTLSQLQALRALSTSLRNIMPDLTDGSNGYDTGQSGSEAGKSWRSERLEYVESATRKHLENVRGLELGKDGEVVDGEWQGEDRYIGPGEVASLEKVAAIFDRRKDEEPGDDALDAN